MKKMLMITGLSVLGVVLAGCGAFFLIINSYLGKITYDAGSATAPPDAMSTVIPYEHEEEAAQSPDAPSPLVDRLEQEIKENIEAAGVPLAYDNNVFNVLLVGIDTRKNSDAGNSDAIILISINRKTSRIVETSLLRDIYLRIPGYQKGNRLNAAYAYGGPALLLKTVRENFKIKVDRYIAVNFYAFMNIIDQLQGVSVNISQAELKAANACISEINVLHGQPKGDGLLTATGPQNLTGKQALGYVRIRHTGKGDFDRTDRQRLVMSLIFDKVKALKLSRLNDLLNTFLPEVRTNLERGELMSALLSIAVYKGYELDSWYLPLEGTYRHMTVRGMAVLGMDFGKNIAALKGKIYGDA